MVFACDTQTKQDSDRREALVALDVVQEHIQADGVIDRFRLPETVAVHRRHVGLDLMDKELAELFVGRGGPGDTESPTPPFVAGPSAREVLQPKQGHQLADALLDLSVVTLRGEAG